MLYIVLVQSAGYCSEHTKKKERQNFEKLRIIEKTGVIKLKKKKLKREGGGRAKLKRVFSWYDWFLVVFFFPSSCFRSNDSTNLDVVASLFRSHKIVKRKRYKMRH